MCLKLKMNVCSLRKNRFTRNTMNIIEGMCCRTMECVARNFNESVRAVSMNVCQRKNDMPSCIMNMRRSAMNINMCCDTMNVCSFAMNMCSCKMDECTCQSLCRFFGKHVEFVKSSCSSQNSTELQRMHKIFICFECVYFLDAYTSLDCPKFHIFGQSSEVGAFKNKHAHNL